MHAARVLLLGVTSVAARVLLLGVTSVAQPRPLQPFGLLTCVVAAGCVSARHSDRQCWLAAPLVLPAPVIRWSCLPLSFVGPAWPCHSFVLPAPVICWSCLPLSFVGICAQPLPRSTQRTVRVRVRVRACACVCVCRARHHS
jgi:hypothetical protein